MLLMTTSDAFALERSAVGVSLTFVAIFLSIVWFTRTMRSDGITVRFGGAKVAEDNATKLPGEIDPIDAVTAGVLAA
jgi:hypothetical protein